MNKELVISKTQDFLKGFACEGAKNAATAYLDAVDTQNEEQALAAFVAELKEDVCTVDDVLEFFGSDHAKEMMGAEKVAELVKMTQARKAAGEKWCDCPGCTAALAIIEAAE